MINGKRARESWKEVAEMGLMIENVMSIAAPTSVAWSVTIDIECWPQWTPTVTSVKRLDQGPLGCGCAALIKQPGLPEAKWVVTELIPGERFTWESRIRGIRMTGTHEIWTREAGTQSILRIEMTGVMARLLWPLISFSAQRSLARENAGLKAKCEALDSQK